MSVRNRKTRRAAKQQAWKLAQGAGSQNTPQPVEPSAVTAAAPPADDIEEKPVDIITTDLNIAEPGYPFPTLKEISPAQLAANRLNAQKSTGALSATTRAISAQNHTIHGLARHRSGHFKILTSESAEAFESLKQSLENEHSPQTETESILVCAMADSHWLAQRAQRLQDTCIDPHTGAILNEKMCSLYLRYQTTHKRAFHKSLNDLLKLRAEKRKTEIGFEAQRIQIEKQEMKKQSHYWEVLRKDGEACRQISLNTIENLNAQAANPDFQAQYNAELAKRGLEKSAWEVAKPAA
jgi:hypothetical protein